MASRELIETLIRITDHYERSSHLLNTLWWQLDDSYEQAFISEVVFSLKAWQGQLKELIKHEPKHDLPRQRLLPSSLSQINLLNKDAKTLILSCNTAFDKLINVLAEA